MRNNERRESILSVLDEQTSLSMSDTCKYIKEKHEQRVVADETEQKNMESVEKPKTKNKPQANTNREARASTREILKDLCPDCVGLYYDDEHSL